MKGLGRFLSSSVGRKQVVAVSGLLLCGFLSTHLAGNFLLYKGAAAFNGYAEFLTHHPFYAPMEMGLAALFLLHILMGLKVSWENLKARPVPYAEPASAGARTWGSSTMKYTGLLTLLFLFVHLGTFRFKEGGLSLYHLVLSWFRVGAYSAFYVMAMLFLGLHLSHGVQSAFQTLGLREPRHAALARVLGRVFAAAMALGFGLLPVWAYLRRG